MIDWNSNETLIQPVIERARSEPDHVLIYFMEEDGSEKVIRAGQFHLEAVRYARSLQAAGIHSGDLVILVLRHSETLLYAFWGAMYLGAIGSIFPFLTEKLDPDLYMQRVRELAAHSQAKAVITFPEFKNDLSVLLDGSGCQVLSTEDIPEISDAQAQTLEWPDFPPDQIAFLQHSSGTTGLQKGVALSHRSVLDQIRSYSGVIGLDSRDVIVSWLPLYHDMGLIAGFVMPIVTGTPLALMSPFKWVRDPKILFQVITRRGGTLCWLPNFAYNHLARSVRARDLEGIQLGSLRAVINCSEPVYHESHELFFRKFAHSGLTRPALSTCYAMAENTFAVTQAIPGQDLNVDWIDTSDLQTHRRATPASPDGAGATPMVSCGKPIPGTEIRVVDDHRRTLSERRVGEIVLRSGCMLSGYYNRPDVTAEAIRDGWYFTGDMGYLADGQLYITGRKKDLIIVGGKNVYPQDLEAIANTTQGLAPGRSVAFGVLDPDLGSENIVMVCETEKSDLTESDQRQIEMDLRRRVTARTETTLADVRLVDRRWLIKTSSGKIARSTNRDKYIREFLQPETN
jgi:acyl-CoA synthetase (AMP-forming)/AMP-acid ligase II